VTRRITSILVLGVLLGTQAAPLAASGRHCAMQRPARARVCCDLSGRPVHQASFSAGSCCRFEAATPRAQAAAVIPPPARAQGDFSDLVAFAASPRLLAPAPDASGSPLPQHRSTRSPLSLHNTLRL
jgi:hypothetical protein